MYAKARSVAFMFRSGSTIQLRRRVCGSSQDDARDFGDDARPIGLVSTCMGASKATSITQTMIKCQGARVPRCDTFILTSQDRSTNAAHLEKRYPRPLLVFLEMGSIPSGKSRSSRLGSGLIETSYDAYEIKGDELASTIHELALRNGIDPVRKNTSRSTNTARICEYTYIHIYIYICTHYICIHV